MKIDSLEIRRNPHAFAVAMLGRSLNPGQIGGLVKLTSGDGAEITVPLTEAQINAALAAIADTATGAMRALAEQVAPAAFATRIALEHQAPPQAPLAGRAPERFEPPVLEEAAAPVDPLAFEVGKTYVTRAGTDAVRIDQIHSPECESPYPVRGSWVGQEGSAEGWTLGGRYYAHFDSSNDLVREARPDEVFPAHALA